MSQKVAVVKLWYCKGVPDLQWPQTDIQGHKSLVDA